MLKLFLIVLVIVGLCVFGMCFNIIFRGREFPKYDVGSNEEMRKRGIRCYKDEDAAMHKEFHKGGTPADCTGDCASCTLNHE